MFKFLTSFFLLLGFLSLNGQLNNNGASIVIESGAKLIVEGDVTNTGTITNNGEFEIKGNLDNDNSIVNAVGSKLIFSGTGNSVISSTALLDIKQLVLNKTLGALTSFDPLNVHNNIIVDTINFGANNFLAISNFDLTLGGIANPILNAADDRFIITNGSGNVIRPNVANAASYFFPIGFSESEYNPITVTNNGSAASISARSLEEAYSTADDDSSAPAPDAIQASWEVGGGTDLDVEVEWEAGDEPGSFDASKSGVSRWDDVNDFWDLTIKDGLGVVGTSASRTGVEPGYFAVGGESVMDYILVLPKVMLSGAYNDAMNEMRTDLTSMLPNGEPYAGLGFTHEGLGGGETNNTFTDIVDWVFVEIREPNAPYDVIGTCSALVKKNGDIIPDALSSHLQMAGFASSDSYRVAIKHRNHLGIMSDVIQVGNRTTPMSFDMINNDVFGTNGAYNNGGTYLMWPGDANGDGVIKYIGSGSDINPISIKVFSDLDNQVEFLSTFPVIGYNIEDLNLDGQVKYIGSGSDINPISISIFSHPGNQIDFSSTFEIANSLPNN